MPYSHYKKYGSESVPDKISLEDLLIDDLRFHD